MPAACRIGACTALTHAVDRVVAATAEATRALPFAFTLTARAENFLRGNPDLDNTIARLEAFDKAGADVLFAPALPDLQAVRAVCAAVSRPVNFMVGMKGMRRSVWSASRYRARHGRRAGASRSGSRPLRCTERRWRHCCSAAPPECSAEHVRFDYV